MTNKKESKYTYVRQQENGRYKVTTNGETVVFNADLQLAQKIAARFGKKVRTQYSF